MAASACNAVPCYHPLSAVDVGVQADTGKRVLKFIKGTEITDWQRSQPNFLPLACGRCIGCRLEKSRQWAVRCVHEASLHEKPKGNGNCFITLTFQDACPLDGTKRDPTVSLHKHHFQRFMKRLRKEFPATHHGSIKYFHCGEYGEKTGRPHHHACLFNFDFEDKTLWSIRDGVRLYRSKTLERLWPFGHSTVGDVTFESAAYVARYVVKKITGPMADGHYQGRLPEFCTMSRGGRKGKGLAFGWIDRFADDVYPKDFIVIRGKKVKVPKYYDRSYEIMDPVEFASIKESRQSSAIANPDNNTARLHAGEVIKKAQTAFLKRTL